MPTYCFKCPNNHKMERFKQTPYKNRVRYRCNKCGLWMYRDYGGEFGSSKTKAVHLDKNYEPISHLATKRSFSGHWVEQLTPQPVFVRNKREYESLLKKTNSAEKPR